MSYAEDNNHDLDPEFLGIYPEDFYQDNESFYVTLIGYGEECEVLIDEPFKTRDEARNHAMTYKGKAKTAVIHKGRPIGFD